MQTELRNLPKHAALLALLLTIGAAAWPADDLLTRRMAEQALAWQQKDRDDLAAGIWQRLLQAEPMHVQALTALADIERRAGHAAQAEALLARAQRAASAPPAPPRQWSESMPATQRQQAPMAAILSTTLAPTRARPESAPVRAPADGAPARPTRPGTPPPAAAAGPADLPSETASLLAKFQTARAVGEDWADTRVALEELVRSHPGKRVYLFGLARHLSYREATRREAIRQFASLSASDDSKQVQAAWRTALLALEARSGDAQLRAAYRKRYPADPIGDSP